MAAVWNAATRRRPATHAGEPGQVRLRDLELREHGLGVGDERARGVGQPDAAAVALEQRDADLALERGELLRDRRRREREGLGGRRDRPAGGELSEDTQASDVEQGKAQLTLASSDPTWTPGLRRYKVQGMAPRHIALAVLVAALWGFNFVVIKVGLEDIPPLLLSSLRYALAALVLVVLGARRSVPWRWIVAVGVIIGVVKFSLLFIGMDVGVPAGLASLVLQAQAFFTLLFAAVLLGERPRRMQVVGMALAFAGIGLVAIQADGGADQPRRPGARRARRGGVGRRQPRHQARRRDRTWWAS